MGYSMGSAERWRQFRKRSADMHQALNGLSSLFEREGVVLAYLFGSLSKGQEGEDVDLAILVRDVPAFLLREPILNCLGTERVDLVDLRAASPVLGFEIIRSGRPIYVADDRVQEQFELSTLRLYRDTSPLRRRQVKYLRRRMGL